MASHPETGQETSTSSLALTLPKIKRILAAVDHENHPALPMAFALAGPLHAEVGVLYMLEPLSIASLGHTEVYLDALNQQQNLARELIRKIEVACAPHPLAFARLRGGPAPDGIIAVAEEWSADLIIMGTRRRGVVSRMLLGSASQAVIRRGTCPVMLVSDNGPPPEIPEVLRTT